MTVVRLPTHHLIRHVNCDREGPCPICDGGLSYCTVCKGAESSLPTHCPGEPMTDLRADLVSAGHMDYLWPVGWFFPHKGRSHA